VGSGNAIRYLNDLLGHPFPHLIVKDGQTLDLGDRSLHFIGSPNLHWPDSMMTYLPGDDLLFTCDIFGEHFCEPGIFDDQVGNFDDAFRYYYDVIMKPYSKFMLQAIEKIKPLKINMICPGHGAILRSHWRKYVDLSEQYAKEALREPKPGTVLILYVSAYRNTGMIAEKIGEGIRLAGETVVDVCDIENMDLATIEQKIIHSSSLIIGCPNFSQNILLPVYQVFALINPIRDRGKLAASFGSYGWSGEGTKLINSNLANLKLKLMDEGLLVKFTPHNEMLQKCIDYGKRFGEALLQNG
jgi:flavorubredoxin